MNAILAAETGILLDFIVSIDKKQFEVEVRIYPTREMVVVSADPEFEIYCDQIDALLDSHIQKVLAGIEMVDAQITDAELH